MTNIDTTSPVLVTGATGYVAGWIVKSLLEAGVTVRAAVRDPKKTDKIAHLQKLAEKAPGSIEFFAADLLQDGSYDDAMSGCSVVFHTASPFTTRVSDPQRDLVDPAVEGTRTVLESANRTESVRRVVLTSSIAAMCTDAVDSVRAAGGKIDESSWNTTASLTYEPYNYSKTLAEKKAWEIAEAQSRWDLVVINPTLVIGPTLGPTPTSESFSIVKQLGNGTMRIGAPRLSIGVVDVREVAAAHIEAAYRSDAQGRHIISAHSTTILDMGKALRPTYGKKYPLPSLPIPKLALWAVAPIVGQNRTYVARSVSVPFAIDNSKGRDALGITYRPLAESMNDMFASMIDSGLLPKK